MSAGEKLLDYLSRVTEHSDKDLVEALGKDPNHSWSEAFVGHYNKLINGITMMTSEDINIYSINRIFVDEGSVYAQRSDGERVKLSGLLRDIIMRFPNP